MITIQHPRPAVGHQVFLGVEFHDGIAHVKDLHPERERALLQHQFSVKHDDAPKHRRRRPTRRDA